MATLQELSGPTARVQPFSAAGLKRLFGFLALLPIVVILLGAVIGPEVVPFNPVKISAKPSLSPNGTNWFGTDQTGLDVFSRTVSATRLNIAIASAVLIGATLLGVVIGLAVGMNESRRGPGGLLCRGLGRVVDLFQAVPAVIIALVVVSFNGASIVTLSITMAVILCPVQARLVRTEVLRVRGEAFIDAARVGGMSEIALTVRHVLPNSIRPALENAPVVFGSAVILTASLGFLGVGVPPPTPEWGSMIANGASDASVGRWWSSLFPSIALVFTVGTVSLLLPKYVKTLTRQWRRTLQPGPERTDP